MAEEMKKQLQRTQRRIQKHVPQLLTPRASTEAQTMNHKTQTVKKKAPVRPTQQQMGSRRGFADGTISKHHSDRWTKHISNWSPAISTKQREYWKQGRAAKSGNTTSIYTYSQPKSTEMTTISRTARLGSAGTRRLEMVLHGKRLCEQQTHTANKTHDPDRHDNDNQTNSSRINNTHVSSQKR